jgi:hypothetical protein
MNPERQSYQKQNYEANKKRVFEIYGIAPRERKNYSTHHINFRREGGSDEKSNLCPLVKQTHDLLHIKVDEMEGFVPKQNPPKEHHLKTHRKRHRHHNRRHK